MIVDWQHDPIKGKLLHVDLKRIDPSVRIRSAFRFTPRRTEGRQNPGRLHEIVTREVEIESLPDDIPEDFTLDVTEMMIGQSIRASDIPMTGGMKLLTPPETVISHVIAFVLRPRQPRLPPATGAPEPEVIKKGKKEEAAAAPEKKDDKKKK